MCVYNETILSFILIPKFSVKPIFSWFLWVITFNPLNVKLHTVQLTEHHILYTPLYIAKSNNHLISLTL